MFYQITYGTDHVVCRWLIRYHVHENGALSATDIHGQTREIGPAMPWALVSRERLPAREAEECDDAVVRKHTEGEVIRA